MFQNTSSLVCGLLFVIGLALAVVGSSKVSYNSPMSRDQAIDNAAHKTRSADGKTTYSITGAEIHQAMHDMKASNTKREEQGRNGKALVASGVSLLVIAGVLFALSRIPNARSNPEPIV